LIAATYPAVQLLIAAKYHAVELLIAAVPQSDALCILCSLWDSRKQILKCSRVRLFSPAVGRKPCNNCDCAVCTWLGCGSSETADRLAPGIISCV
jgi:hypothetical protein